MFKVEYTDCVEWHNDNGALEKRKGKDDGKKNSESSLYESYYLNGKAHRKDAPAIIFPNYVAWYLNGIFQKEERGIKIAEKYVTSLESMT